MALIIDGYNLLHVTGLFGRASRGGALEASRQALLEFLADTFDESQRRRITIVFDASEAPPGLPRTLQFRGMTVHFAQGYPDADAMIEQLIRADTAPRQLTVVSSDHRIQRAARRRRAEAIDSDLWYAEVWRGRRAAGEAQEGPPAKPQGALSPQEVERWMRELGQIDPDEAEAPIDEPLFPPGYGEDLTDE